MDKGKQKNISQEFLSFIQDDTVETFEPNYQNKFIKVFVEDKKKWCQQIMDIMFPEYFEGYHKILINYQMEYFEKYRIQADYDDLRDMIGDNEKDDIVKEHLHGLIEKIQTMELEHQKRESVRDRAYEFFKSRKIKNTLIELAVDWKKHKYDGLKTKLEDALKAGEPKDVGHNYMLDVESRLRKDYRSPIPALDGLDEKLGGGLAGGELGIVLAPPGGGKSMMLVRFATTALQAGKKVVYYSMELSEKVIGQRFDSCLNGVQLRDVWSFKETIKETIDKLALKEAGLIIKEFPTGKATVNNIYSHLETLASNENFIPDVVLIDYADIMKASITYSDKRHTLTGIYEELRGLAVEMKIPIWTASQTNRGAMDKEKYGLDSIGESLGKAATADVVIGIGRTPDSKSENFATIGVLKNRNGQDGFYLDSVFDTSKIDIKIMSSEESPNAANMRSTYGPINGPANGSVSGNKTASRRETADNHQMTSILSNQNQ